MIRMDSDDWEQERIYGQTYIIQGASGAGKTSILEDLKRRWTRR